jgi:chemotaxis protein MotB
MSARRRRRRHEAGHANHERWLVSYADFITLLFAFFVVMYAISSLNEGKYRVLSNAMQSAFGTIPGPQPASASVVHGQPVVVMPVPRTDNTARVRREERELRQIGDDLLRALGALVEQGRARVMLEPRGVVVEIGATALFASGDARLAPGAEATLVPVAAVLGGLDRGLRVEGHTDNVPIASPQFPSNWELSAARAAAVARVLIGAGVAAPRVAVVGYADTRPVAGNDADSGRARNRRVTLLVVARETADPVKAAP